MCPDKINCKNNVVEINEDDPISVNFNNTINSWINNVCTPRIHLETVKCSTLSIFSIISSTTSTTLLSSSTVSSLSDNKNKTHHQ